MLTLEFSKKRQVLKVYGEDDYITPQQEVSFGLIVSFLKSVGAPSYALTDLLEGYLIDV